MFYLSPNCRETLRRTTDTLVDGLRRAERNPFRHVLDDARELGILPARSDDPARANSHSASGRRV